MPIREFTGIMQLLATSQASSQRLVLGQLCHPRSTALSERATALGVGEEESDALGLEIGHSPPSE